MALLDDSLLAVAPAGAEALRSAGRSAEPRRTGVNGRCTFTDFLEHHPPLKPVPLGSRHPPSEPGRRRLRPGHPTHSLRMEALLDRHRREAAIDDDVLPGHEARC